MNKLIKKFLCLIGKHEVSNTGYGANTKKTYHWCVNCYAKIKTQCPIGKNESHSISCYKGEGIISEKEFEKDYKLIGNY